MSDTIAAIATGNVLSAIGIIRLSGDTTLDVIDRVFRPFSGAKMSDAEDRRLIYGKLLDPDGATLDICLCTISRAPRSYTGETTAELQCHGSPAMLRAGLSSLFAAGARQALPGEFTKRAFLNGRMDLTQAEAVIDLIHAETAQAAKNAAGQLDGAISRKIDNIYSSLTDISAHYHAVLDYPDEDIEDFRLEEYAGTLSAAMQSLRALLATAERGSVLRSGIKTAIIGLPNAGKSSFLNLLLGYERAIVTDIPGTTRDTIEERVNIAGLLLRLIDTAGLREAENPIEQMGILRSREALHEAELVIAVIDGSRPPSAEDLEIVSLAKAAPKGIIVLSKLDIKSDAAEIDGAIPISSVTGEGLDAFEASLKSLFPENADIPAGEILTSSRQQEAVSRALDALLAASSAMAQGFTPDAVLVSCEAALSALGELTGKTAREDITARIFERFCVGK